MAGLSWICCCLFLQEGALGRAQYGLSPWASLEDPGLQAVITADSQPAAPRAAMALQEGILQGVNNVTRLTLVNPEAEGAKMRTEEVWPTPLWQSLTGWVPGKIRWALGVSTVWWAKYTQLPREEEGLLAPCS